MTDGQALDVLGGPATDWLRDMHLFQRIHSMTPRIFWTGLWTSLLGVWLLGCASGAGQPLSLGEVKTNVSWKMDAYRMVGVQTQLTENQQQAVSSAYAAYQNAFQQALSAAGGNLKRPAPQPVIDAVNALSSVLDSL